MKATEELKSQLTDDPLKNIYVMAPYLDEKSQYKMFGWMMCALGLSETPKGSQPEVKS